MTYTNDQVKATMKHLRNTSRITTTKAPGGMIITICKYDYYQTPKNYETPTNAPTNTLTITRKKELKNSRTQEKEKINIPFDTFWDLYDKKSGRGNCEAKWNRLSDDERSKCMAQLPAYVEATPDKKFRKDPIRYLNNKSWEDEIITHNGKSHPTASATETRSKADDLGALVANFDKAYYRGSE
jgi:hypothetical protein